MAIFKKYIFKPIYNTKFPERFTDTFFTYKGKTTTSMTNKGISNQSFFFTSINGLQFELQAIVVL